MKQSSRWRNWWNTQDATEQGTRREHGKECEGKGQLALFKTLCVIQGRRKSELNSLLGIFLLEWFQQKNSAEKRYLTQLNILFREEFWPVLPRSPCFMQTSKRFT